MARFFGFKDANGNRNLFNLDRVDSVLITPDGHCAVGMASNNLVVVPAAEVDRLIGELIHGTTPKP
jgi:hypothetical protein